MVIELAHFFSVLALAIFGVQFFVGSISSFSPQFFSRFNAGVLIDLRVFEKLVLSMSYLGFGFLVLSFALLTLSFLNNDFSVLLVASHSSVNLPIFYKFAAVWGNHEGSILLWGLVLAFYSALVAYFSKSLPSDYKTAILAVLALINAWLLTYLLFLSSPFTRFETAALNGNELNPLLQDLALIFHPPILYFGYVGLAVPFACILVGLVKKDLSNQFLLWIRPWAIFPWLCLTAGVSLGSFWAYYELGWGGWWFWDPVENSSFMPWLTATALIHSLVVSQKRASQKNWTVILALLSFNLSLLGTFLVRSGVITSVHSFASDPNKGLFILFYLAFFSLLSIVIYLIYFGKIKSKNHYFSLLSRETMILLGNIFLIASFFAVFLGTLYPLFLEAMNLPQISIGKPYYNQVFVPLMVPILVMMALAPWQGWNESNLNTLFYPRIRNSFILSLIVGLLGYWYFQNYAIALAFFLSLLIILLMLIRFIQPSVLIYQSSQKITLPFKSFSALSMQLAHIGVAVFTIGAVFSSQLGSQTEKIMSAGDRLQFRGYEIVLEKVDYLFRANYTTHQATMNIFVNSKPASDQNSKQSANLVATIYPEKRAYQNNIFTSESSIYSRFLEDITVSFAEVNDQSYSFRFYYQPLIRLIWLGVMMMVIAGILALFDKRFRQIGEIGAKDRTDQTDKKVRTSSINSSKSDQVKANN